MPSTLMCRCTPMRSNQRRNSRSSRAAGPPRAASARAIAAHPVLHALARPGDVAILQQRDEVVADRPAQRVLEIDDAGIALARRS